MSHPSYTLQKVAEITPISATHIRMTLECDHSFTHKPLLKPEQTIEDWTAAMQRYVSHEWRCKTCRPAAPAKGAQDHVPH